MTNETQHKQKAPITYIPLVQQALAALQSLNPVERAILGLRFGLDDGLERSLDQVARHYGVPAEVIRSVEIDALRKLRQPDCYIHTPKKRKKRAPRQGQRPHLYVVE